MKEISKAKRNTKNTKGITLIALVVTIIVLLILAGVSVMTLVGENGILTQAQKAKKTTEVKSAEEKVKLAVMAVRSQSTDGTLNAEQLESEVTTNYGGIAETTAGEFPVTVTIDGKSFIVDSDGNIEELEIVSASDITESLYGAKVTGYTLPSGTETSVGWKIFYADSNNIYLIADNYVERENLPGSTGGTKSHKPNDGSSSYPRAAYFSNILGDYAGSSRIAEKQKKLNNSYFYKEDGTDNYSSTYSNMKSVAYMMDTEAWNSKFLDTNKAEYVIGGPTVELLFKSYNKKYKKECVAGATNQAGYSIKEQESGGWNTVITYMLNPSDPLYVINSEANAEAYWLASPSASYYDNVMYVSNPRR